MTPDGGKLQLMMVERSCQTFMVMDAVETEIKF